MQEFKSNRCHHFLYVAVSQIIHETVMNIYSDKLPHVQVVINCQYFVAQLCTHKDMLAYISGALFIEDVMSYNSLTTLGIWHLKADVKHL